MTERTAHRTPSVEVEAAVLDAAEQLVASAGPAGLSIRGLAAAARVAPMSIYNRFGDKAGVLDALFTRGFQELAGITHDPAYRGVGLDAAAANELLRQSGEAYRRFALQSPGTYALMFDRGDSSFAPSNHGIDTASLAFEGLVELVVQGQAAGGLVGGGPVELAQRIWATIHGAVSLELRAICFADDSDAHFQALLDTILVGLAPDRAVPGLEGGPGPAGTVRR